MNSSVERPVLVTGATGLVGSALLPRLRALGFVVRTSSRDPASDHPADLTLRDEAERVIRESACGAVLNLAALADVDACESDPATAFRCNAGLARDLAEAAADRVPIVHIGTDHVYDGAGPHCEEIPSPINVYAYSKLVGDLWVAQRGGTVLRTNFIGPGRSAHKLSFCEWAQERLAQALPFKAFTDVFFTPLSAGTMAAAIAATLRRPIAGIFNLGSHVGMSKRDAILSLAQHLGLAADCAVAADSFTVGLAARRPKDMRMDVARFEATFSIALPTLDMELELIAKELMS